jgi:hypothetical protein
MRPAPSVRAKLFERDRNLGETARRRRVHRCGNFRKPGPDEPPAALAEDHDRDSPIGQVLLVANVSISREEQFKSGRFGCVEEPAVPERVPAVRAGFLDDMTEQHARDTSGCPVGEENAHQRPGTGASKLRPHHRRARGSACSGPDVTAWHVPV